MNNPFNPSFGKVPPIYIDRVEQVEEYIEEISNPDSPYQTTLVYGQRGSGKTVFMNSVKEKVSGLKDWIVFQIPLRSNILQMYLDLLSYEAGSMSKIKINDVQGLTIGGFGIQVGVDKKVTEENYLLEIKKLLKKVQNKNVTVLAIIDEVENTEGMKRFLSVFKILIEERYPVRLLLGGLPQNILSFQNARGLTFLHRAPQIIPEPLSQPSMRYSYKKVFTDEHELSKDDIKRMSEYTMGYPYAFQLMGYLVWKNGLLNEDVLDEYKMYLFKNSYAVILDELSDKDKEFLRVIAEKGEECKVSDIEEGMGVSPSYVSRYRRRLIDVQLIRKTGYGSVGFTLPFFGEYIVDYL